MKAACEETDLGQWQADHVSEGLRLYLQFPVVAVIVFYPTNSPSYKNNKPKVDRIMGGGGEENASSLSFN